MCEFRLELGRADPRLPCSLAHRPRGPGARRFYPQLHTRRTMTACKQDGGWPRLPCVAGLRRRRDGLRSTSRRYGRYSPPRARRHPAEAVASQVLQCAPRAGGAAVSDGSAVQHRRQFAVKRGGVPQVGGPVGSGHQSFPARDELIQAAAEAGTRPMPRLGRGTEPALPTGSGVGCVPRALESRRPPERRRRGQTGSPFAPGIVHNAGRRRLGGCTPCG
jgi:hypothetical protein